MSCGMVCLTINHYHDNNKWGYPVDTVEKVLEDVKEKYDACIQTAEQMEKPNLNLKGYKHTGSTDLMTEIER